MASLTASAQLAVAAKQIDAASRSAPLSSIGAEAHPPDFLQRPTNLTGANARAAYWLAVAARPTRSDSASQGGLLNLARQALVAAQAGESWFALSSEAARVDGVLWRAESAAASVGRSDVAAILNAMRGQEATAGTQQTIVSALSRVSTGFDLTTPQGRTIGSAAITVAVPIVIGGVVLWFAWPVIAELFGVARAAATAGAVSGIERRAQRRFSGEV